MVSTLKLNMKLRIIVHHCSDQVKLLPRKLIKTTNHFNILFIVKFKICRTFGFHSTSRMVIHWKKDPSSPARKMSVNIISFLVWQLFRRFYEFVASMHCYVSSLSMAHFVQVTKLFLSVLFENFNSRAP